MRTDLRLLFVATWLNSLGVIVLAIQIAART